MGAICNNGPAQLHFDASKYNKQPLSKNKNQYPSIQNIVQQKQKHNPDPSFAKPVKITQLPQLTHQAKKRLAELGDYKYQQNQNNKQIRGQKLGDPFKFNNGAFYDGQWMNGIMHGRGKYYLPRGFYLQTITKNGKIQGPGRIIAYNGNYYQGQIKGNQAHGKGMYIQDQTQYVGGFQNNLQHGYGQQMGIDYIFKGHFQQGQRAKGTLIYGDDSKICYEGELKNNQPHGIGKLQNQIGVYQGQFQFGQKQGKGKFTWKDGHVFIGHYQKDHKNGQGCLYNPLGKQVKRGKWRNDQFIN